MSKVLSLTNSPTPEGRAAIIEKYSFDKRFWSDFPDNKPHDSEDNLIFLLAPFDKIKSLPPSYDNEKKILIRLKMLWERCAKELGEKATPREIVMEIMNFFMLRIYQRKEFKRNWVKIMDILYDSYFTSIRIRKYNKLRLLKSGI
jgi:hypothetical protein